MSLHFFSVQEGAIKPVVHLLALQNLECLSISSQCKKVLNQLCTFLHCKIRNVSPFFLSVRRCLTSCSPSCTVKSGMYSFVIFANFCVFAKISCMLILLLYRSILATHGAKTTKNQTPLVYMFCSIIIWFHSLILVVLAPCIASILKAEDLCYLEFCKISCTRIARGKKSRKFPSIVFSWVECLYSTNSTLSVLYVHVQSDCYCWLPWDDGFFLAQVLN